MNQKWRERVGSVCRVGAWALLFLGFTWVVLAGSRSPVVLGTLLGPAIEEAAEARGLVVEIKALDGVGWTGVRLRDIQITRPGREEIHWSAPSVEIYPSIRESLRARAPVVSKIIISTATIEARSGLAAPEAAQPSDARTSKDGTSTLERWLGEEVEVLLGTTRLFRRGQEVFLEETRGIFDPQTRSFRSLKGEFSWNDLAFTFQSQGEEVFIGFDQQALEERLSSLPVDVRLEAFVLPGQLESWLDYENLEVGLEGLEVVTRGNGPLRFKAHRSSAGLTDGALRWSAEEAEITGQERSYSAHNIELLYRRDVQGFGYQGRLIDESGGWVEAEGMWHIETGILSANLWLERFFWDGSLPFFETDLLKVQGAQVDGVFHGEADLVHLLVRIDGDLAIKDLSLYAPLVAGEEFEIPSMDVELPLTVDLRGGAASVTDGKVTLGELGTFRFDGRVVEALGAYAFDATLRASELEASQLQEALPEALLGAISTIEMDGQFGVTFSTSGHSAYPESLLLDVVFAGDVAVLQDLNWLQWELDLQDGQGLLFESDSHQPRQMGGQSWTYLRALPPHVPAAILSAEDSGFYDHQGLDWRGLRMAMVHNLEAGALVRGGSTISQQVAKNIFLSHDRTLSRKMQEAFLTWRLEESREKDEILELYLNVAQLGPEHYGLYEGAAYYFAKGPESLSVLESVLLGSILPSPRRFGSSVKAGYLPSSREDKMRRVLVNMRFLDQLTWEQYFRAIGELDQRRIGEWQFERCADDDTAPEGAPSCEDVADDERIWRSPTLEETSGWIPLTH